jgi:hypothetical protein
LVTVPTRLANGGCREHSSRANRAADSEDLVKIRADGRGVLTSVVDSDELELEESSLSSSDELLPDELPDELDDSLEDTLDDRREVMLDLGLASLR